MFQLNELAQSKVTSNANGHLVCLIVRNDRSMHTHIVVRK